MTVGRDLSLPAIVGAIAGFREAWLVFSRFAERVMSRKEEERLRQRRGGTPDPGEGDHLRQTMTRIFSFWGSGFIRVFDFGNPCWRLHRLRWVLGSLVP